MADHMTDIQEAPRHGGGGQNAAPPDDYYSRSANHTIESMKSQSDTSWLAEIDVFDSKSTDPKPGDSKTGDAKPKEAKEGKEGEPKQNDRQESEKLALSWNDR